MKLGNNDKVTFKEIEGMVELNNWDPMKIKVLPNDTIEIGDTSNFSNYISGGVMIEIKSKKELNFNSLEERLNMPYLENEQIPEQLDVSKYNTNKIIYIGILALNKFYKDKNIFPELSNKEDAKELIIYGKKIYESKKKEKVCWLEGLEEEFENFYEIIEKTLLTISLWQE